MRILMIAPEPFFEPRGTPFSEYHRIRALTALGHQVDLVTYPFGQDVAMPGLRIFRSARPPFLRGVKVGPSLAKVPLDICLALAACRRALTGRYDAVHSHEEGGVIGVGIAAALRLPHLYDMHSSLPQQLSNFALTRSRLLLGLVRAAERLMVRRSRVVVVICPALEQTVRDIVPLARVVLIENAPGSIDTDVSEAAAQAVRSRFGLGADTPLLVYTGTFEAYQGLDLLFAALSVVRNRRPDVRLLLVGGKTDQVARARVQAEAAGAGGLVIFAGEQPATDMFPFLCAGDVLVSPRSTGTNTPLKIYQYLRSGRPIVATRLLTHTQVLDDSTAVLTAPTPEDFARGVLAVLDDPQRAAAMGRRARELADTKYSYEAYLERTRRAYSALLADPALTAVKDVA
jgi:glycosyltransferase involved in cell wall biosynthesis